MDAVTSQEFHQILALLGWCLSPKKFDSRSKRSGQCCDLSCKNEGRSSDLDSAPVTAVKANHLRASNLFTILQASHLSRIGNWRRVNNAHRASTRFLERGELPCRWSSSIRTWAFEIGRANSRENLSCRKPANRPFVGDED